MRARPAASIPIPATPPSRRCRQRPPQVRTRALTPGHVPAYEPDSPDVDADGLVGAPNVDLASNIVELTQAGHA
jgi:hypothetical protein